MAGALILTWFGALALASGAPAFAPIEGKDLVTGSEVRVEAPSSRHPVVVIFLSSRCPCSAGHEEALRELAASHPEARFVAINSNSDESVAKAQRHFARAALPFPILRDQGAVFADRWGALKTPHAFVFGANGELLFQGGIDDSKHASTARKRYLADALGAIKAGKKPDPARARALGCTIQR